MPLLSRTDAPIFNLPGIRFTTLVSPSRGALENAVWEVTVEPGGGRLAPPPDTRRDLRRARGQCRRRC